MAILVLRMIRFEKRVVRWHATRVVALSRDARVDRYVTVEALVAIRYGSAAQRLQEKILGYRNVGGSEVYYTE